MLAANRPGCIGVHTLLVLFCVLRFRRALPADEWRHRANWRAVGLRNQHDGFRFICWRVGDRLRVFSRRGHDWTETVR